MPIPLSSRSSRSVIPSLGVTIRGLDPGTNHCPTFGQSLCNPEESPRNRHLQDAGTRAHWADRGRETELTIIRTTGSRESIVHKVTNGELFSRELRQVLTRGPLQKNRPMIIPAQTKTFRFPGGSETTRTCSRVQSSSLEDTYQMKEVEMPNKSRQLLLRMVVML